MRFYRISGEDLFLSIVGAIVGALIGAVVNVMVSLEAVDEDLASESAPSELDELAALGRHEALDHQAPSAGHSTETPRKREARS